MACEKRQLIGAEPQEVPLPRYCETDELAVRFRRHTRTIRDRIQKGRPVNGRHLKLPATRLFGRCAFTRQS